VIRVYDEAANGTHEHKGDFKEPPRGKRDGSFRK
jgi:hypothetical protein